MQVLAPGPTKLQVAFGSQTPGFEEQASIGVQEVPSPE
jgi:hypothetical protein